MNIPHTKAQLQNVIVYLEHKVLPSYPSHFLPAFKQRWQKASLKRDTHGKYEVYHTGRLVIPVEEQPTIFARFYSDPKYCGSLDRFYEHLSAHLCGFSKADVKRWMSTVLELQLHKRSLRPAGVNPAPVFAGELGLVQMDLADLSYLSRRNRGYKYLLVLVDTFTKKVWIYPLKQKSDTYDAVLTWLRSLPQLPKKLQSDNGGEFSNMAIDDLLKTNGIIHVLSDPYSPWQNGIVERMNGTVKRLINSWMVATGQQNYVDHLDEFERNINTVKSTVTHIAPAHAHEALSVISKRLWEDKRHEIEQIPKLPRLELGDKVRIALNTQPSRPTLKKRFVMSWSNEIYTLDKVFPAYTDISQRKYQISDEQGRKLNKLFNRHQLQRVDMEKLVSLKTLQ
jgi:hypothetical protein